MAPLSESFLHDLGSWRACGSPINQKLEKSLVMNKEAKNLTRVGEEVVAVGPRQRLDTPGAQSVCRESLQTMHLDHNSLGDIFVDKM